MADKVCLITGVGPGTGAALARRFSAGGYKVAMLARDTERLTKLEAEIPNARAYRCDVADLDAIPRVYARVRDELGPAGVLLHNAVGGAFGNVLDVEPRRLEVNFRINTLALLVLAQTIGPDMVEAGSGAIIATGNTSALRGKENFAAFAPTKAAQRILCESMARHMGPKGIHVAYVVIDAVIDVPWTRRAFSDRPDDFFIRPAGIADTVFYVAHQERSAWTFQIDLRPFGEEW